MSVLIYGFNYEPVVGQGSDKSKWRIAAQPQPASGSVHYSRALVCGKARPECESSCAEDLESSKSLRALTPGCNHKRRKRKSSARGHPK